MVELTLITPRQHIRALKAGVIPFRPFCAHPVPPKLFVEQYGNENAAPINAAFKEMVDVENALLLNNAKLSSKPTPECCAQACEFCFSSDEKPF